MGVGLRGGENRAFYGGGYPIPQKSPTTNDDAHYSTCKELHNHRIKGSNDRGLPGSRAASLSFKFMTLLNS